MARLIVASVTLCMIAVGCGKNQSESPQSPASNSNQSRGPGELTVQQSVSSETDFSIPRLSPKPVMWLSEYEAADELSPEREEAKRLVRVADMLKGQEVYDKAGLVYEQAINMDPTWPYPPYQLACNLELSGDHEQASAMFEQAVNLGLDDFPTVLEDNELGEIRQDPDFMNSLARIRKLYIEDAPIRVGQPLAIQPDGEKPQDGRPMILLLHGYGDSNLSYLDNAQRWADLGFVAVAVPGSVPLSVGRFRWWLDSLEPTLEDLQAIVNSPLFDEIVDRERVYLLGFSQGALHAMLLTFDHPDVFAGVIVLSPGGGMAERMIHPKIQTARTAKLAFIHGLNEAQYEPYVDHWRDACEAAGWQYTSRTHAGGHHFPEDWDEMRIELAGFLLADGVDTNRE